MKFFTTTCVLLAACLTTFGCAMKGAPPLVVECKRPAVGDRPGPALVGMEYGLQATPIPLNSIQYSDRQTSQTIAVQRIYARRTEGQTVEVAARFVSCSDLPTALLVRTSFMRDDQSPSEQPSAWQTVLVQPRMTANYTEASKSIASSYYLIEIMPAR